MPLGRELHSLRPKCTGTNQKHQRQNSKQVQNYKNRTNLCLSPKLEHHLMPVYEGRLYSLLKPVSIKQKFSQHAASSAHKLWTSWHSLSLLQIHVEAGSVCRGSYSYPNWKIWNSEVVVTPSEMGENSPDVHTCSVTLFSALHLRSENRVY